MDDERTLVIVEDDETFARTLQRSFERRGYRVWVAASPDALVAVLRETTPRYAVVDLKLGQASGLACVQTLHAHDPGMLIVVLTGFASIATAVEAIKLGACHYLAKPSNTDDIEAAFHKAGGDATTARAMSGRARRDASERRGVRRRGEGHTLTNGVRRSDAARGGVWRATRRAIERKMVDVISSETGSRRARDGDAREVTMNENELLHAEIN